MNRSQWWKQRYYYHIAGISTLPSITKIEVSLHTSSEGLIENNTEMLKDIFPTELQHNDYSRQLLTIDPITRATKENLLWSVSESNWSDISAIGFIGTCILSNNVYNKCLWFKLLDTSVTKNSASVIFIPKNEVVFT